MEWYNDKRYYNLVKDLEKYPEAWCYVIWSARKVGKTYSGLRWSYENNVKICYAKRTKDDVDIICDNSKGIDLSPFKPINRDSGSNVKAVLISKGIGGFYESREDGNAFGEPLAYVISLNATKTVKGMDMSDVEWLFLDEFIPQAGEIVRRKEGEMVLDLYMTVSRDREKRGRKPLKLILCANAEQISTPITNELDIIDDMAEMQATNESYRYLDDRGILLRHILPDEYPLQEEEKSGIYKGMLNTNWFKKSFEGEFANNDFSCVKRVKLKGYIPWVHLHHKQKDIYIYYNDDGDMYITSAKADCPISYDLNREVEQRLFACEELIDIYYATVEGKCFFQKYSFYDLIMNYKKLFII